MANDGILLRKAMRAFSGGTADAAVMATKPDPLLTTDLGECSSSAQAESMLPSQKPQDDGQFA